MELTTGLSAVPDKASIRPAELRNLRSVKWCTGALSLNNKISATDAKDGSLSICVLGEYLVDFEFVVLWSHIFPKGENTTQLELMTAPLKLQSAIELIRNERESTPEHTPPFLSGINYMKEVAQEIYEIRQGEAHVSLEGCVREFVDQAALKRIGIDTR